MQSIIRHNHSEMNEFSGLLRIIIYSALDCMPSLNLITINALVAACEVVIPLHAQYYSVRGLEQLLQTIGSVKSNGLNMPLEIAGILYTCVNDRTTSFRDIQKIIYRAYGESIRIFENYIPRSVKEAAEKVDTTAYIWYNIIIKYRRWYHG